MARIVRVKGETMRNDLDRETSLELERVQRDAEVLGASSLARAGRRFGRHFAGLDTDERGEGDVNDPIEVWGRRIGRALSVVLAALLTWWLGLQLGWWTV